MTFLGNFEQDGLFCRTCSKRSLLVASSLCDEMVGLPSTSPDWTGLAPSLTVLLPCAQSGGASLDSYDDHVLSRKIQSVRLLYLELWDC